MSNLSVTGRNAAQVYQENMVPSIFSPFAQNLLKFGAPRAGDAVLDAACGTGAVAFRMAREFGRTCRIVGLDLDTEMLDVARNIGAESEVMIDWIEGDISRTQFLDGEFDLIFCQQGLQYFSNREKGLSEIRRVLSRKGRLVLSVWRSIEFNPGYLVFAEVLERRVSEQAGATRRAPFVLSDKEEIRALISEAGFRDIQIELETQVCQFLTAADMVQTMIDSTALGAELKHVDQTLLGRVMDEVTFGLNDYVDDKGLALPMQAWVVTAIP